MQTTLTEALSMTPSKPSRTVDWINNNPGLSAVLAAFSLLAIGVAFFVRLHFEHTGMPSKLHMQRQSLALHLLVSELNKIHPDKIGIDTYRFLLPIEVAQTLPWPLKGDFHAKRNGDGVAIQALGTAASVFSISDGVVSSSTENEIIITYNLSTTPLTIHYSGKFAKINVGQKETVTKLDLLSTLEISDEDQKPSHLNLKICVDGKAIDPFLFLHPPPST